MTGATGFIGRALCRRLRERGIGVRACARRHAQGPWDDFVAADLGAPGIPEDLLSDVDTVFHLAGKAHALSEVDGDDSEHRRVNVGGTSALLALAARGEPSRFILFSSVKAMGDDGEGCMDEEWRAAPTTPYGESKLECERLLFAAGRDSGLHVCALRLPLVYGRGVKGNLWKMLEAIDRGRFPRLPALDNKRSLVHVDDVVEAALRVGEDSRANGQTYIVADARPYSTDEICRMMRAALGKPESGLPVPLWTLRCIARAGDVIGRLRGRRFVFDSDAYRSLLGSAWYSPAKIERELGFRATRGLGEGVKEMVEAYRELTS